MFGISGAGKENIGKAIETMFDNIALSFIGNIPRLQNAKLAVISSEPNLGLAHLFVQSMQNKTLNPVEQEMLKGMLTRADGYIQALKFKTKSNLSERIEGLVREATLIGSKVDPALIESAIEEEMKKARSNLMTIIEAEATKFRNLGTLMDITRVSSSLGDNDPTVFFVVIKDNSTCKECIRLHLQEDGVTPRLWKFSQLKQGYHKRGEDTPSAFGLHPHCRCSLAYLSRGFGFNSEGKLTYIAEHHDAHSTQK